MMRERTMREGTTREGTRKQYVKKIKKNRSLDLNKCGSISEARSEAISGASRIIVIEVHYPTYCPPSCPPYQTSRKISVY
jgi:hypothetical protein